MIYNTQCCAPTYLVSSVTLNTTTGTYILNFRTVPTLLNGSVIKFRLSEAITTATTAGTPITANVTVNGTTVAVPLRDCIGNTVRAGESLQTRKTYTAVFGTDANHLQIVKVDGKPCLRV